MGIVEILDQTASKSLLGYVGLGLAWGACFAVGGKFEYNGAFWLCNTKKGPVLGRW
jgi:hypothetical protein